MDGSDLPAGVLDPIRSLDERFKTLEAKLRDLKSRMITVENLKGNDVAALGLQKWAVFNTLLKYFSPQVLRMKWCMRGKETS